VPDLRVELLAVEDCPHLERARIDLQSVLRTSIIEVPIQLIFVSTQDEAEFLEFPGSPTIRVNGEDVVPQPQLPFVLGCRIYKDDDGRRVGSPPISAIKAAVDAQRRGRLEQFRREEAGKLARFAREADASDEGGKPASGGSEPPG
jgi:hypothetical protein